MSLIRKINKFVKFMESSVGRIVVATILYVTIVIIICCGMYRLSQWSLEIAIIVYCLTLIANSFIITKFKYLLFLERYPGNVFSNALFCILGPISLAKVLYIFMCLSTLINKSKDLNTIIMYNPHMYENNREINRPNSFINSILKYQQRLRDYT